MTDFDFYGAIQKMFFGDVPEEYKWAENVTQDRVQKIFENQNTKDVFSINYALLIEDMLNEFHPDLKGNFEGVEISDDVISKVQHQNRILIGLTYQKVIQDINIPPQDKLGISFFYLNLLTTGRKIYCIELVKFQDDFESELRSNFNKYIEMASIRKVKPINDFEIDKSVWALSKHQLTVLSEELQLNGYIDDAEKFRQVFGKKRQEMASLCNWLGKTRLLIFLFDVIQNENDEELSTFKLDFISNYFTIKNERKSLKDIREAYRQIRGKKNLPHKHLENDWLKINNIFLSTQASE